MRTATEPRAHSDSLTRAREVLLLTQAFFFLTLVVCLAINHGPAAQLDGISFYGVYHGTIEIIVAGFAVAAAGLWRAAEFFAETGAPLITQRAMRFVAIGLFGLLVTPFNHGGFLNWSHMTLGVAIALTQGAMTIYLTTQRRSFGVGCGLAIQLAGGVLSAASLPNWHFPYLLQGEMIYQIGFGWCLIEWTYALRERYVDVS